jgi:outer membrane murein-binding lipoprotein Lpp
VTGIGAGLLFLGATARPQEAVSSAELLKIIAEQNRKIEALSQQVQELAAKQTAGAPADTSQLKRGLMETNEALAQTNKRLDQVDQKLVLGKGIDGVKLTGDLRVRYETRDQDYGNYAASADDSSEDRARFRTRFRIGLLWSNPTEEWEAGAGLATGGDDGRSTNDTWGETNTFETGDIRLDYAYAKHRWMLCEGLPMGLTLGQQKIPYVTTYMLWDSDLRPTGVTLQLGDPFGKEYSGPFATLGAYDMLWGPNLNGTNNDQDVFLFAGQVGYAYKSDPVDALVALGLYHVTPSSLYDAIKGKSSASYDPFKYSPGLYAMGAEEEWGADVVDLYLEATKAVAGFEIKPYLHGAMNLSADGSVSQQYLKAGEEPEDNDLAGLVGVDVRRGKWKVSYNYARIGADAVFGPLKDSDFGETAGLMDTDVQGHKIGLSYSPVKNLEIGLATYLLDRINGGSEETGKKEADSTTCMQLDAVYKF